MTEAETTARAPANTWRRPGRTPDNPAPVTPALPYSGAESALTPPPGGWPSPMAYTEYPPVARELLPKPRSDQSAPGWRPWPAGVDQCWRLYYIYGLLPTDAVWWLRLWNRLVSALLGPQLYLLYIGITGQYNAACRPYDHVIRKEWAPDIRLIEFGTTVYDTEADAEAQESAEIRTRRPLHNVAHNRGNPRAADSKLRRLPRHLRIRRLVALWRLTWRLCLTAIVWALVVNLAAGIGTVGRALDSTGGRLMIVAWAVMVVFGAGRARKAR